MTTPGSPSTLAAPARTWETLHLRTSSPTLVHPKSYPPLTPPSHQPSHQLTFLLKFRNRNALRRHRKKNPLLNLGVSLASQTITGVSLPASPSLCNNFLCPAQEGHLLFLMHQEKKPQQVFPSTVCLHHRLRSPCASPEPESRLPSAFSAPTGMGMGKMLASTATVGSLPASDKVYQHIRTLLPALPDILSSPTRRMCGQCWRVLIKKGFVTPTTMFGLERGGKRKADQC